MRDCSPLVQDIEAMETEITECENGISRCMFIGSNSKSLIHKVLHFDRNVLSSLLLEFKLYLPGNS